MCTHCGCGTDKAKLTSLSDADQSVVQLKHEPTTINLQQAILAGNDAIARENRQYFADKAITCINLMGTPGAGKTQLLEMLSHQARAEGKRFAVLEGDQHGVNDAQRIKAAGGEVVQINTGTGCHLDAAMINAGVKKLATRAGTTLIIENVGNLVCPALFDLGESLRITMMAVTDGADKPEKYPHIFRSCDLVIINKIDLLPYVSFDMDKVSALINKINPDVPVYLISAQTGEGVSLLMPYLNPN